MEDDWVRIHGPADAAELGYLEGMLEGADIVVRPGEPGRPEIWVAPGDEERARAFVARLLADPGGVAEQSPVSSRLGYWAAVGAGAVLGFLAGGRTPLRCSGASSSPRTGTGTGSSRP